MSFSQKRPGLAFREHLYVRSGIVHSVVRGEPTLLVYCGEYLRDALRSHRVTES